MITEWRETCPCDNCDFNPRKREFQGACSGTKVKDSCYTYERYKVGIEAQRRLLEYLQEPCDEHDCYELDDKYTIKERWGGLYRCYMHRRDCPQCRAEIEKEIK